MLKIIIRSCTQLKVIPQTQVLEKLIEICKKPSFTLGDCKNEILSNYKSSNYEFITGIKVSPEELDSLKRVANSLKPEELESSTIPVPVRKEIAEVIKCDIWEVTKFIILLKSHSRMHEYLQARITRKESLPSSIKEIKHMLMNDPMPKTKTTAFLKFRRQKQSKFQKKIGSPVRNKARLSEK